MAGLIHNCVGVYRTRIRSTGVHLHAAHPSNGWHRDLAGEDVKEWCEVEEKASKMTQENQGEETRQDDERQALWIDSTSFFENDLDEEEKALVCTRSVIYLSMASVVALVMLLVSDALSYSGNRYNISDVFTTGKTTRHRTGRIKRDKHPHGPEEDEKNLDQWLLIGREQGTDILLGEEREKLWDVTHAKKQCTKYGDSTVHHLEYLEALLNSTEHSRTMEQMKKFFKSLHWKNATDCSLLMRHCICNKGNEYDCRKGSIEVDTGGGKKTKVKLRLLPRFSLEKSHPWGSCAIVGNDQSIIDIRNGYDINEHDTVIRIGQWYTDSGKRAFYANSPPVLGFQEDVGYKTDVTFMGEPRHAVVTRKKARPPLHLESMRLYMSTGYNRTFPIMNGKPVLSLLGGAGDDVYKWLHQLLSMGSLDSEETMVEWDSPLLLGVLTILRSNLCQKLDVYGSGVLKVDSAEKKSNYYWWAGEHAPARSAKEIEVEFKILNAAMQAGVLCTYV